MIDLTEQIRSMLAPYTGYDGMTSSEADDLATQLAALLPKATETVEYEYETRHPGAGCCCRDTKERTGRTRTRTSYADCVVPWEAVDGDE